MNNLTINGHLVKDMEIKDVKGLLIGEFTIANNQRVGKDKEETTFLKCRLISDSLYAIAKTSSQISPAVNVCLLPKSKLRVPAQPGSLL